MTMTDKARTCELCCTKISNFGVVRGNVEILKNINLHIHCGELTAIIGPNGAGKSTLLKAILGEVKHSGELHFVDSKDVRRGQPLIGYVPQQLEFDKGSPASVLDLFTVCKTGMPVWLRSSRKIREQAVQSLARVQAGNLINRKLGNLSGGELQRVLLALALDPIPNLLLLDEPVSGIDQNGLELFYKIVSQIRKEYDLSIILVSHDLDLVAQFADRVVLLNKTVLCCGTAEEVFASDKIRKVFNPVWSTTQWASTQWASTQWAPTKWAAGQETAGQGGGLDD